MNTSYRHPAVRPPSFGDILQISEKWDLKLNEDEIKAIREKIVISTKHFHRLMDMPEPTPPVKYPRTVGLRPAPDDNPLNAWHWKTDIQGGLGGLLSGKTVALKDSIGLASVPLMNGSKIMDGFISDIDATIVTRILDAGGRIIGKAACEDLSSSSSSFNSLTGQVLNPVNNLHSAGGSSSGCAALVAGGYVDVAVGCDQGCSIRIPSSWCGIVGLKPTFGLVPLTGIMSLNHSVDHAGPMTRTVEDCALLLEVIAGGDGFEERKLPHVTIPRYSEAIKEPLAYIKIGLVEEAFVGCRNNVDTVVRQAAERLKEAGVAKDVEDVSIPMHHPENPIVMSLLGEESFETTFNGNGFTYGTRGYIWTRQREHFARGVKARAADMALSSKYFACYGQYMKDVAIGEPMITTRRESLHVTIITKGLDNYGSHFISKASNMTGVLRAAYDKVLETYDVILMPTTRCTAPKIPSASLTPEERLAQSYAPSDNAAVFNITGHPVLTINAGYSPDNLPVGVSIIGKHYDESMVLKVAKALETVNL